MFPAKETFLTDEEVKDLREEHVEVEVEGEEEKGGLEGEVKVF